MPNVNRQTIYQMGNVVNDVVRQATGRDPVQAISMDYVTVEQNTLMGIETQSGAVVTFNTPRSVPLLTLEAQIVAQQNLHGYDYPWAPGGGKNKFSSSMMIEERSGLADDGTLTTASNYSVYKMFLPVGNYIWSGYSDAEITSQTFRAITYTESDTMIELFKSEWERGNAYQAFTITEETAYVLLSIRNSYTNIQVEAGSTVTDYAPYSNICPITGFTGCNISVSGGDNPERIYPVEWETEAGMVYGGTLDVINGKLTVERASITFDGTQTGMGANWQPKANSVAWYYWYTTTKHIYPTELDTKPEFLSSSCPVVTPREVVNGSAPQKLEVSCYNTNAIGIIFRTTDMTLTTVSAVNAYLSANPVQIVFKLATQVVIDLTPQQISTLAGENVISADTGDISLSYYVYHDLL